MWDIAAGLPVILQDSEGNTYVYGLDLISRTDDQGVQEYYLYDGLGSTTDLTDDDADVVASYGYDVFGAVRNQTGSSPNEFTFTGEQVDGTGLQYLRARYYDPEVGRFLGRDPLPFVNRYAYVGNNPVNFVDPTGLHCKGWHPHHCVGDAGECVLNAFDCIDPRQAIDPLIGLLPEESAFEIFGFHLSIQLLATCASQYPEACIAALEAWPKAQAATYALYGPPPWGEGEMDVETGTILVHKEGDAFQHCYWSGLTTLRVGAGRAKAVTTRFEAWGSGNPAEQRAYDLHNNARGRGFAQYLRAAPSLAGEATLLDYCRG